MGNIGLIFVKRLWGQKCVIFGVIMLTMTHNKFLFTADEHDEGFRDPGRSGFGWVGERVAM